MAPRPARPAGARLVVGRLALLTALALTLGLLVGVPADAAPARPGGLTTAARYTTGLRLAWTWRSGLETYQIQLATNASFTGARTVSVAAKRSRPSSGTQKKTVKGLLGGTRYWVRVRAVDGTASPWSATHATATKAGRPAKFQAVTTAPGPGVGQATISWRHSGASTRAYQVETGLTSFSRSASSSLPSTGRNRRVFTVPASRRSLTLTAAQMADAGASTASGNHLYLRVYALGTGANGDRAYPKLRTVIARPQAPAADGAPLRAGSFNVRTAYATGDKRSWNQRVPDVAADILGQGPGLVALQELNPGRPPGSTVRQTESLLGALQARGGGRYRLTRTTAVTPPGQRSGSQGARLLYDADQLRLLSACSDTTGTSAWNRSCSVPLPVLGSDTLDRQRHAAVALFEVARTGTRFWAVSVHLDERHSGNSRTEAAYDTLRRDQAQAVLTFLARNNPQRHPVVFGGDLNSWQNNKGGHRSHDLLVRAGYYDSAAAVRTVNRQYGTTQQFRTVVKPSGGGFGPRLDVVMVLGAPGSSRYANVLQPRDSTRASDHNLVVGDLRL